MSGKALIKSSDNFDAVTSLNGRFHILESMVGVVEEREVVEIVDSLK